MTASDHELIGKPAALQGRTRVLVIDDDRKLCRLIRDHLEPMGHEVSAAHSGTDGVERAVGEAWDAVILDCHAPGKPFEAVRSFFIAWTTRGRGRRAERVWVWRLFEPAWKRVAVG